MAEHELALPTAWGQLCGTLLLPDEGAGPWPAVLLIAGSGPTDRDGNNLLLPQPIDNLKLLARALARRGLASLRYDKRGIGASSDPDLREDTLRFDDMVADAVAFGRALQADERCTDLALLGHSEGALIAALAAQPLAPRAVVSVSGAGERASALIRKQLQAHVSDADLLRPALAAIDALDAQHTVDDVPETLFLLLRPSVQPYLISWFHHDPSQALAQVRAPVLILHGEADTRVEVEQAHQLHAGKPDAQLRLLAGMDHLLALDGDYAAGAEALAREVAGWLQEIGQGVPA